MISCRVSVSAKMPNLVTRRDVCVKIFKICSHYHKHKGFSNKSFLKYLRFSFIKNLWYIISNKLSPKQLFTSRLYLHVLLNTNSNTILQRQT